LMQLVIPRIAKTCNLETKKIPRVVWDMCGIKKIDNKVTIPVIRLLRHQSR
jgi:hypothetical protein